MADWRLDQRTEETPVESDITILSRGTSTFKTTFKKIKDFIIGTTALTTTADTVTGAIEEVKGIADSNTTQLNAKANNIDSSRTTTAKDVTGAINELNTGKAIKPNVYNMNVNGYFKDPTTGLIIQWGRNNVPPGDTIIALPIAYPSGIASLVVTPHNTGLLTGLDYNATKYSTSQIQIWSNGSNTYEFNWITIGF